MEVLIDTNIILDWFLKREPFFNDAKNVLNKCWFGNIKSYLTIHSICDLYYIIHNNFPIDEKKKLIQLLCSRNEVIEESKSFLTDFIKNPDFDDLEDALQICSAESCKLDYIITRNIKDFAFSKVLAITPKDFLDLCK